jgi:hypothetical protein
VTDLGTTSFLRPNSDLNAKFSLSLRMYRCFHTIMTPEPPISDYEAVRRCYANIAYHVHFFTRAIDTNYHNSRIDLRDNQIWPQCFLRLMLPLAGLFHIMENPEYPSSSIQRTGSLQVEAKRTLRKLPQGSIHSISSARSTAIINTNIVLAHLKLSHEAVMASVLGSTSDLSSPFSTGLLLQCVQLTNSAGVASQSDLAISNLSKSSNVPPSLL